MKIIPVEGNRMRFDGGAMFGNAPKILWEKWFTPDEQNRISLASRTLLVQLDSGLNVLIDAGIGAFYPHKLKERYGIFENEHKLLENLARLGVREQDIDAVALSHLHFDHAGGILSSDGPLRLLFPRAKFYVAKSNWERAKNPKARDKASFHPDINRLLEESGRLILLEKTIDLPGFTFTVSEGHTPGLLLYQVANAVFASDLVPGSAWLNQALTMGYDRYAELVCEEKKALLDSASKNHWEIFFPHDPHTASFTPQSR